LSKRGLFSVLFLLWEKAGDDLNTQILITILSVIIAFLALIIGFFTFNRNRDKDVRNDATETATIKTQLSNILVGIDSIRIDIKANERRLSELAEKVVRIDESTKSAHKRLDHLENKGEMER
jgi:predicted RND superfamily exporter protein